MMVVRCLRFCLVVCGQSSSRKRWLRAQTKEMVVGSNNNNYYYWPLSLPKPKSATEPQTPADIKLAAGW